MVAKINRGKSLLGAIKYNLEKVDQGNGSILSTSKIIESGDGSYNIDQFSRSFQPYLMANRKTEKPILHISLNPDPKDKVSADTLRELAQDYMRQMGYSNQPFAVFKHTDIDRTHIHIVSVCVNEQGKKISDTFEKRRSMDACRKLEQQYNLINATQLRKNEDNTIFRPVDYSKGDVKSQIAAVIRYLPKYYKYQSFGAYNALLAGFNITAEEIKGEYNGKPKQGMVYFAIYENGEKVSNPFKASLFGKSAGYALLQSHYRQSVEILKTHTVRGTLKNTIEQAIRDTSNEKEFKKLLTTQGIDIFIRRNAEGRLYGITFIDHKTKTVWNGSQLAKELSANIFNELWNRNNDNLGIDEKRDNDFINETSGLPMEDYNIQDSETNSSIINVSGLLPESQGEDYEEMVFENLMKRKNKRRTR